MKFKIKFGIDELDFIIIGGLVYIENNEHIPYNEEKQFLGENYALFRIYDFKENSSVIKSLLYSKFPILIIQLKNRCFGYMYQPVTNDSILSVKLSKNETKFEIEFLFAEHLLVRKENAHLGLWQEKKSIEYKERPVLILTFERRNWIEILQDIIVKELKSEKEAEDISLDILKIKDSVLASRYFLNRLFDYKNLVHTEFIIKDKPISYGGAELFSLITFEFYRAFNYCKNPVLETDFNLGLSILKNLVDNEIFFERIPELNNSVVYHNTIGKRNNGEIYGHTQFNTGWTGYPGGQATIVKILGKFLNEINLDNAFKEKIKTRLYDCLKFIDYLYSPSGVSYSYPLFWTTESELFKCESSPKIISIAGTVEVVNAYFEIFKLSANEEYLNKAITLLNRINPSGKNLFFKSYGFLRDANYNEVDGVSAVEFINANVTAFYLTDDVNYKEIAEVFGYYLLTFQYFYETENLKIKYFADPMVKSFSPRLAIWDTVLWAESYFELFKLTKRFFWLKLFKLTLYKALNYQSETSGGIPESIPFNYIEGLSNISIENGISFWIIKLIMNYCNYNGIIITNRTEPESLKLWDVIENRVELRYDIKFFAIKKRYKLKKIIKRLAPRFLKRKIKKFFPEIKPAYQSKKLDAVPLYYSEANYKIKNLFFNYIKFKNNIKIELQSRFNETIIIEKVFFPVLKFEKEIIEVKPIKKIKNNFKQLKIIFSDYNSIIIDIEPFGIDGFSVSSNELIFDTSLKANWNNNGRLELNLIFFA